MAWYRIFGKDHVTFFLHHPFDPLRNWIETESNGLLRFEESYETAHRHPALRGIFSDGATAFTYVAEAPGFAHVCFTLASPLGEAYNRNRVRYEMVIEEDRSVRMYGYGESLGKFHFYHYLHQAPRLQFQSDTASEYGGWAFESNDPCLEVKEHVEPRTPFDKPHDFGETVTTIYDLRGVRPGSPIVRVNQYPFNRSDPISRILAAFTVNADLSLRLDAVLPEDS